MSFIEQVYPNGSGYSSLVRAYQYVGEIAATGETGFDDVSFDLISVQYHSLKAGHDYGQYVRDAKNAGQDDVASFFEEVMSQDAERARRCHEFIKKLGSASQ